MTLSLHAMAESSISRGPRKPSISRPECACSTDDLAPLQIIPRARISSELIAHEAEDGMCY